MHFFIFNTNNINMTNKIKNLIKVFNILTKNYSTRILASSVTYNLILIIIPLISLIETLVNKIWLGIGITSLVFVINLLWTTSSLILTLKQTSDIIYYDIDKRGYFRSRVLSFIYCLIVILLIVLLIVFNLVTNYLGYYISSILVELIMFFLIISFIYKKIIPVYVKYKTLFFTSFIITISWCTLSYLFVYLLKYLEISYYSLYNDFALVFVFIYYLYLISYIFVVGIIYQYYLYKKSIKS